MFVGFCFTIEGERKEKESNYTAILHVDISLLFGVLTHQKRINLPGYVHC